MNLERFRAWSSSSWGSVALFDVVGSLIGGNYELSAFLGVVVFVLGISSSLRRCGLAYCRG